MGPIGSQAESHKPHLPLNGTPAATLEAIQEALECLGAGNSYIPVFWKPVPEEGEQWKQSQYKTQSRRR